MANCSSCNVSVVELNSLNKLNAGPSKISRKTYLPVVSKINDVAPKEKRKPSDHIGIMVYPNRRPTEQIISKDQFKPVITDTVIPVKPIITDNTAKASVDPIRTFEINVYKYLG